MRRILHHKALVFLALVIWLIASWSGAHGHLCFDGQEPPMTVHMDALSEHLQHDSSEQHVDADVDLSQFLIVKLVKVDLPWLIAAALLLVLFFKQPANFVTFYVRVFSSRLIGLLPPLRAPPAIPA